MKNRFVIASRGTVFPCRRRRRRRLLLLLLLFLFLKDNSKHEISKVSPMK